MEAETQYLTIETQASTITWCSINISRFLLQDCQMRALHESSMEEIKGQESNHEFPREETRSWKVRSLQLSVTCQKTPKTVESLNTQKNVIFREMIILDLNFNILIALEKRLKIILYGLKSIFIHRPFTVRHRWLDTVRIKKIVVVFSFTCIKVLLVLSCNMRIFFEDWLF